MRFIAKVARVVDTKSFLELTRVLVRTAGSGQGTISAAKGSRIGSMSLPPKTLRASVAQAACCQYDLEKTLDKLERLTQLAKDRDNSQLVVFPEGM